MIKYRENREGASPKGDLFAHSHSSNEKQVECSRVNSTKDSFSQTNILFLPNRHPNSFD